MRDIPHNHHDHRDHLGSHLSGHRHSHGAVDPTVASSDRGIWAVKWSFWVLFLAAALQLAVVIISNSIGLLADTIHNFADAATAIPLGIAFILARKKPSPRFTYGHGRVEDFAGIFVVATIFASAIVAGYESVRRLIHPQQVTHLWAVALASIIGFVGNEGVAIFRIKVGKEIGSAALIADGYHARTDGWTSLAVLVGALGVWFGFPVADPIIGLFITVAILFIVWDSAKEVFTRALDGIDPSVVEEIRHSVRHVAGVEGISDVRARWSGHRLLAEVNIAVPPHLTVQQGHDIATEVNRQLLQHLQFLARAVIHVDPTTAPGEIHHNSQMPASNDDSSSLQYHTPNE